MSVQLDLFAAALPAPVLSPADQHRVAKLRAEAAYNLQLALAPCTPVPTSIDPDGPADPETRRLLIKHAIEHITEALRIEHEATP
jgi:hypothetical protein